MPVILTSGYARQDEAFIRFPMLRKPYQLDQLRVAIANLPKKTQTRAPA
jgi:hypothetical protein